MATPSTIFLAGSGKSPPPRPMGPRALLAHGVQGSIWRRAVLGTTGLWSPCAPPQRRLPPARWVHWLSGSRIFITLPAFEQPPFLWPSGRVGSGCLRALGMWILWSLLPPGLCSEHLSLLLRCLCPSLRPAGGTSRDLFSAFCTGRRLHGSRGFPKLPTFLPSTVVRTWFFCPVWG